VLLLFLCLSTVDLKDWTRSVQDLIAHGGFCAIDLQDLKGSVFLQSLQVREKMWREFFSGSFAMVASQMRGEGNN
jgi:hypothetical protein